MRLLSWSGQSLPLRQKWLTVADIADSRVWVVPVRLSEKLFTMPLTMKAETIVTSVSMTRTLTSAKLCRDVMSVWWKEGPWATLASLAVPLTLVVEWLELRLLDASCYVE